MKHYSTEHWSDYVRGLAPDLDRAEMERHLASGCQQCQRSLTRMRAVSSGLREQIDVPEPMLARARAIFSISRPESPLRKLVASLVFDTLGRPVPLGIRGRDSEARRLAYAVEDIKVELLVDTRTSGGGAILTGQVSTANTSAIGHIRLMSRNKTLGETRATEFGEFQMEIPMRAGLRLLILEPTLHREIELPLDLLLRPINPPSGASENP